MPDDLAQRLFELGVQQAGLVAVHQVFERVVHVLLHFLHVRVIRVHQGKLLLEHQHAGGDAGNDVIALVDQADQFRDVFAAVLVDRFQVALFQLGHAAAFFLVGQAHRDAVVLEYPEQVLPDVGCVHVAVTSGEQGHLSGGRPGLLGLSLQRRMAFFPLSQGF